MTDYQRLFTALITPFDREGALDEKGFRTLIRRQVEGGVKGIFPLGSTGESPTLTHKEQKRIIEIAREETPRDAQLMVGTGTYSTAQTIENTLMAKELGADCALIVTPYYNKPTQEGLYLHYSAVAKAVDIPFIIYNVPYRTGVNIQTSTLKRLMAIPTFLGIKEASGNISQISEVIELAKKERPDFKVYSGDDALTLPLMALGGYGVISVASNLIPDEMAPFVEALAVGDYVLANEIHYELSPLFKALFIETNPAPIKAAMNFMSLPSGKCRLPLSPMSDENLKKLEHAIQCSLKVSATH